MKVISVTPIEVSKAVSARAVVLNMATVLESQVEIAEAFNLAISDINKAIASIPCEFDSSDLSNRINNVKKLIPKPYNDRVIKSQIATVKGMIQKPYDDTSIKKDLSTITSATELMSENLASKEWVNSEIKDIKSSIPSAFNDSSIKKSIENVKKSIPKAYDDSLIKKSIAKIASKMPTAYNDSDLKRRIESVEGTDSHYDDKEVRKKIDANTSLIKELGEKSITESDLKQESKRIRSGIVPAYDDKTLKSRISKLEENEKSAPTESSIVFGVIKKLDIEDNSEEIKSTKEQLSLLTEDFKYKKESDSNKINSLTEELKLVKAELKSTRKNLGSQFDELLKRVDKITESK